MEVITPMQVQNDIIYTKDAVKYLGVTLDNKLNFRSHLKIAAEKARTATLTLSRLMANIGGPVSSKRRLLMSTTQSIILYGAEIWADAMKKEVHRQKIAAVQRLGALRITSSYRTVSEPAVLVIAGTIPIDLLAQERKARYEEQEELGKAQAAEKVRALTWARWQERWEQESRGRWTARLIPRVEPWVSRDHGEVDFYLTQFLSAHGYFRAYLYRAGKIRNAECKYCDNSLDDAEHTFFHCRRWAQERIRLEEGIGQFSPDNVVGLMLGSRENWEKVSQYVQGILRRKRMDGCLED